VPEGIKTMIGKVQKFSELKGFGFLLQDFRTTVFFHVSGWTSSIPPKIGMRVTYDLGPSRKPGMPDQAVNIVPLGVESSVDGAQ
jgi:cold shock CspA family protein